MRLPTGAFDRLTENVVLKAVELIDELMKDKPKTGRHQLYCRGGTSLRYR